MKDYLLFIPPNDLATKKSRDWTGAEAKRYFEWFISIKDYRVEYLLTSIDESLTGDNEDDIERIGRKVTRILTEYPFSEHIDGILTISNRGLALCADMSLLISKLIIDTHPIVKWMTVKKPKRDLAYNLPALSGFPVIGHIELMRGCITEAKAILRGEKTDKIWLDIYKHAVGLIS